MSLCLTGQTALVTGAAVRTGRAIALALAEGGADLIVHANHSVSAANELAVEIRDIGRNAWVCTANFEEAEGARRLANRVTTEVGRLDILVNNVGNYPVKSPLAHQTDELRATLESNLIAPFTLIRELAPLLDRSSNANVVNLGYAGVEQVVANRNAMAYQISKTGLLILTKTLAQELGPRGIRVNMVSPGHLDNSVDLPSELATHVPLQRAGTTSDIIDAIFYMLKPGSYVTGTNLEVAGGYRLSLSDCCL